MSKNSNLILTVGSWLFIAALIPSVVKHQPPTVATSLLTAIVLGAFACVYASHSWFGAAASTGAASALWLILLLEGTGTV